MKNNFVHKYQILVIQSLVDAIAQFVTIRFTDSLVERRIRMSVYVFQQTTKRTSSFLDTLLLFPHCFHISQRSPLSLPPPLRTNPFVF